jgi:malate dehydrogenase (oxaloacetate-decarboxylating)(NADP+)
MAPTKPMATQYDLSLAYSPGVAEPCREIFKNPDDVYLYTNKSNLVAVVSNGTAVLGLGDLGALASKPVMEGKAVLFKRFADVDVYDIELDSTNTEEIINAVKLIAPSFGGINLEDIKAPECFEIESRLRAMLDIPVFHDDQHGTAIISTAALLNALELTGKRIQDIKVVVNGAGAAGVACSRLYLEVGVQPRNLVMCDTKGVIHKGRRDLPPHKAEFALDTPHRTLAEVMVGADMFLGLSAKGAVDADMLRSMNRDPIVFALANPDPEITYPEAVASREDVIMATGRSDYPNQVNNVLGFPFIFRGALDVRAREINEAMKVAAARAIATLAKEDVPEAVLRAYGDDSLAFGRTYIIPKPFDPRLIWYIPPFVAQAAMDTGVARKPIADMDAYRAQLAQRLDPAAAFLQKLSGAVMSGPKKRIVFAEGEEPSVIRAAHAFQTQGLGEAILIGREDLVKENMRTVGLDPAEVQLQIVNARVSDRNPDYVDHLYQRLQREGYLKRDVQRLINQDRNSFAASMVALGDADGMVTGVTRSFDQVLEEVLRVIDPAPGGRVIGMSIVLAKGHTLFIADTNVTRCPRPRSWRRSPARPPAVGSWA